MHIRLSIRSSLAMLDLSRSGIRGVENHTKVLGLEKTPKIGLKRTKEGQAMMNFSRMKDKTVPSLQLLRSLRSHLVLSTSTTILKAYSEMTG